MQFLDGLVVEVEPFQSTPDREAGRCRGVGEIPSLITGFNPRPTVRPGDAAVCLGIIRGCRVSIHARP